MPTSLKIARTNAAHLHRTRHVGQRVNPAVKPSISVKTYRSEEHTSELQSRRDLVCRLLLEKKKKNKLKSKVRRIGVTTLDHLRVYQEHEDRELVISLILGDDIHTVHRHLNAADSCKHQRDR